MKTATHYGLITSDGRKHYAGSSKRKAISLAKLASMQFPRLTVDVYAGDREPKDWTTFRVESNSICSYQGGKSIG